MATLYISEFSDMAEVSRGAAPAALQPPAASQTVAVGGASVQSSLFNAATRFVRLHTDIGCSVLFGTNPTALTTSARMAAGQTEYFGVPVGGTYRVAVISNE